jgi:hypothetical protein
MTGTGALPFPTKHPPRLRPARTTVRASASFFMRADPFLTCQKRCAAAYGCSPASSSKTPSHAIAKSDTMVIMYITAIMYIAQPL